MRPESRVIEQLFRVVDKVGGDVPFRLNQAQAKLDREWTGRDVVPKARQRGVSTWELARFTVACLGQQNVRAVVISHEAEATERMLAKVRYFLNNLQSPPAVLETESRSLIKFKKTNSAFYIGTAGSKAFGRGDTITHLHCSEVAFWDNPKKLVAGLFQAVPSNGEIAVESTGNGKGNWYHNLCMRSFAGRSRFKLHFLPWFEEEDYRYQMSQEEESFLMANLNEDWEEPELVSRYGITAGQLAWRRDKIDEFDEDLRLFKQEYPTTLDECFQSTGHGFFPSVTYVETKSWQRRYDVMTNLHMLKPHPMLGHRYAIGADVAGGVGKDYSVAEIVDLDLNEQVGEWRNNTTDPHDFAFRLRDLGRLFHNAYVTVENNNHGILTLSTLREIYSSNLIHSVHRGKGPDEVDKLSNLGLRTSSRTKPFLIGRLRKSLKDGFIVHSPILKSELDVFEEHDNGKLGAPEGMHDDCVMALGQSAYTAVHAETATTARTQRLIVVEDPFGLDAVLRELRGRAVGSPISSGVL